MKPLSPEQQRELKTHIQAIARIMYDHTEPEKLETFESIEIAVKAHITEQVSPGLENAIREQMEGKEQ